MNPTNYLNGDESSIAIFMEYIHPKADYSELGSNQRRLVGELHIWK